MKEIYKLLNGFFFGTVQEPDYLIEYFKHGSGRTAAFYWHITHKNGNIVADGGEGYKNRKDCEASLNNLLRAIKENRIA